MLDASRIERLEADTFRCFVGGIDFFSFRVEPVLVVSVVVGEHGPTIRLLSCRLQGSPVVEAQNRKFRATMTNNVRWRNTEEVGKKEVRSDLSLQLRLVVPSWFLPGPALVQATGKQAAEWMTVRLMLIRFSFFDHHLTRI